MPLLSLVQSWAVLVLKHSVALCLIHGRHGEMSEVPLTNWQNTKKLPSNSQAAQVWLHYPNLHQADLGHSFTRSIGSEKTLFFFLPSFNEQQQEPEAALLRASVWEGLHAAFTPRRIHHENVGILPLSRERTLWNVGGGSHAWIIGII